MSEQHTDFHSTPAKTDQPLLEIEDAKKHFVQNDTFTDRLFGNSTTVKAVDGVSLSVGDEEIIGVVGESGCGKSTLAKIILNLERPTSGTVRFKDDDITGLSDRKMRSYRRDIQMIFQDPLGSLNPRKTVREIIKAPLEVHDIGDNEDERMEKVTEMVSKVGLKQDQLNRHPRQFSGGQQQRVAIARALILEPDLLIADEPVSALDVSVQAQILTFLREIQESMGLSIVFIAHDLGVVRHIADRVVVMYLGNVVETGPTDQLFNDPKHPYTKSLLSAIPRIGEPRHRDRIILRGTVPSPIDPPNGCRFNTRCPVVIPPSGWRGTQEQFNACFEFRNRIEKEEFDLDVIKSTLEATGDSSNVNLNEALLNEFVSVEVPELPPDAASAVANAAEALVADDVSEARERLSDAFPTPCEQEVPRDTAIAGNQVVACHRYDEDAPGEPEQI